MAHYTGEVLTSDTCPTLFSKKFPLQAPAYVHKENHTCQGLLA
jgi:hypothetical protein